MTSSGTIWAFLEGSACSDEDEESLKNYLNEYVLNVNHYMRIDPQTTAQMTLDYIEHYLVGQSWLFSMEVAGAALLASLNIKTLMEHLTEFDVNTTDPHYPAAVRLGFMKLLRMEKTIDIDDDGATADDAEDKPVRSKM